MMQIVKPSPITVQKAERIPREDIPAVVAECLDGRGGAKQHALPGAEARELPGQDEGEDVEEECLEPVAVDGAVGV